MLSRANKCVFVGQNCYWTGFYTSRPGLKRLERVTSAYLQAARQLQALVAARGFNHHREALAALEVLTLAGDEVHVFCILAQRRQQHLVIKKAYNLEQCYTGVEYTGWRFCNWG